MTKQSPKLRLPYDASSVAQRYLTHGQWIALCYGLAMKYLGLIEE